MQTLPVWILEKSQLKSVARLKAINQVFGVKSSVVLALVVVSMEDRYVVSQAKTDTH